MENKTKPDTSDNLKTFVIRSKDYEKEHQAVDRMTAYAQFFKKVLDGEIKQGDIGQIVMASEQPDGKEIGFRVVPTLVNLGVIDEATGILNVIKTIEDISSKEANELLDKAMAQDKHMVERVEALNMEDWG